MKILPKIETAFPSNLVQCGRGVNEYNSRALCYVQTTRRWRAAWLGGKGGAHARVTLSALVSIARAEDENPRSTSHNPHLE